ncbi:unnamed protein product, partial [Mesorhabditis belari]|uniref:Uncharacterized protein n=1 Tax=Mesorhabditis belari TaxID=2138241 RepID=A0AAF3EGN5_9BILA
MVIKRWRDGFLMLLIAVALHATYGLLLFAYQSNQWMVANRTIIGDDHAQQIGIGIYFGTVVVKSHRKVSSAELALMTQMLVNTTLTLGNTIFMYFIGNLMLFCLDNNAVQLFSQLIDFNTFFFFNLISSSVTAECFRRGIKKSRNNLQVSQTPTLTRSATKKATPTL